MSKRMTLALGSAIVLYSVTATAAHCPMDVRYIDNNMSEVQISAAEMKVVKLLRDYAAEAHKNGEHDVSVVASHLAIYAMGLDSFHSY